jgi:hypothetical protein
VSIWRKCPGEGRAGQRVRLEDVILLQAQLEGRHTGGWEEGWAEIRSRLDKRAEAGSVRLC